MLVSVSVTTLQGATLGSMGVRRHSCRWLPEAGLGVLPPARGLRGPAAASLRACAPLVNLPGVVVWLRCCNPPQATGAQEPVRAAKRVERRRCAGRRCVEAVPAHPNPIHSSIGPEIK